MLSLATEPACLRHLELRIAPQKTLAGWTTLFKLWEGRYAGRYDGADGSLAPRIRFVVHFIRDANPAPTSDCRMQFGKLRRSLDRQTALLQLFRRRHPALSRYIVGLDVANLERGCGPELFAPYLQLLRGDSQLAGNLREPALECWGRLEIRDQHRSPMELPPLGITYHAGEDFHHPVDGMRAMSGLVRNLLRPGDRIGHGLAVGIDVEAFQRKRGNVGVPQGVLLDDLVWLRREARALDAWTGSAQREIDQVIGDLTWAVYGSHVGEGVLERSLDIRFSMPRPSHVDATPERVIWSRETFEDEVGAQRARIARPEHSARLLSASKLVEQVQAATIRSIRDAGVSVEANPSSNLVTGAIDRLRDHPFFKYLAALGDQLIVSINTDDPGVFGTRIDIEYALMLEAMLENGFDRGRALGILEASRDIGSAYAFDRRSRSART